MDNGEPMEVDEEKVVSMTQNGPTHGFEGSFEGSKSKGRNSFEDYMKVDDKEVPQALQLAENIDKFQAKQKLLSDASHSAKSPPEIKVGDTPNPSFRPKSISEDPNESHLHPSEASFNQRIVSEEATNVIPNIELKTLLTRLLKYPLPRIPRNLKFGKDELANPFLNYFCNVYQKHGDKLVAVGKQIAEMNLLQTDNYNIEDASMMASALICEAETLGVRPEDLVPTLDVIPGLSCNAYEPEDDMLRVLKTKTYLECLMPRQWINDEVVENFLGLLMRTNNTLCVLPSYLASFWEVDNFTTCTLDYVQLDRYEHVLLPICTNNHWVLLYANMKTRCIALLDSIPSPQRRLKWQKCWRTRGIWRLPNTAAFCMPQTVRRAVLPVENPGTLLICAKRSGGTKPSAPRTMGSRTTLYLECKRDISYASKFLQVRGESVDGWSNIELPTHRQDDSDSCGVFLLMHGHAIASGLNVYVNRQHHVPAFRKYVLTQLITQRQY